MSRRSFLLTASAAVFNLAADDAEARKKPKNPGPGTHFIFESLSGDIVTAGLSTKRRHPASLTKMMTLYGVMSTMKQNLDVFNEETVIEIPEAIRDLRSDIFRLHNLRPGQKYPAAQLMIASGSLSCASSTTALAVHAGQFYGGKNEDENLKAFVGEMNEAAQKIGMKNSFFRNTVGTPDKDHYSTAADMAKLVKELYADFKQESKITMGQATPDISPVTNGHRRHTSSYLRAHDNVIFAKTGTTNDAGHCLAAMIDIKGVPHMGVVIGATSNAQRNQVMSSMVHNAMEKEPLIAKGNTQHPIIARQDQSRVKQDTLPGQVRAFLPY